MKSEQCGEDMIDITSTNMLPSGQYYPIFFDGDQLTRERASGAQDANLQSVEEQRKMWGVFPESSDWHALVTFYQVYKLSICIQACMVY